MRKTLFGAAILSVLGIGGGFWLLAGAERGGAQAALCEAPRLWQDGGDTECYAPPTVCPAEEADCDAPVRIYPQRS